MHKYEHGDYVFALKIFTRAPHLFNHVPDFPLLTFQHVVQMVDLFSENSHLLLQLLSPESPHREL